MALKPEERKNLALKHLDWGKGYPTYDEYEHAQNYISHIYDSLEKELHKVEKDYEAALKRIGNSDPKLVHEAERWCAHWRHILISVQSTLKDARYHWNHWARPVIKNDHKYTEYPRHESAY
ncbi:hypothetical protein IG922_004717 [Salmonella enterica]|nr:hypothetical protein [Salmonella enterica]